MDFLVKPACIFNRCSGAAALYASDQSHYSVIKAALLAGFSERNLHEVPVDGHFRIRIDALRKRIASDRAAGLRPFLIVANAGTTNTGAVDDLEALQAAMEDIRAALKEL